MRTVRAGGAGQSAGAEFSERKGSVLWNTTVSEASAVAVAEHLAEGCSLKGTARRMSAHQVHRSLAFARRPDIKLALGWWGLTVYNWSRPHRSLRQLLPTPQGNKHQPRTPAMALTLADHILSIPELLLTPVLPAGGCR